LSFVACCKVLLLLLKYCKMQRVWRRCFGRDGCALWQCA